MTEKIWTIHHRNILNNNRAFDKKWYYSIFDKVRAAKYEQRHLYDLVILDSMVWRLMMLNIRNTVIYISNAGGSVTITEI